MWSARSASPTGPGAVIVEDEPALREELAELLRGLWPQLRIVAHAADGATALQQIDLHAPDIVFLDIQIPDPNGLQVARMLRDRCHIVFVTAYDAHAIEAFDNGAVDYILKPIDPERLAHTVRRLQQRVATAPADLSRLLQRLTSVPSAPAGLRWITASVGNTIRLITVDEIVYFQSDQKFTRVVLASSEVLIKRTLKELILELDPEQFWQTHRSTLVNVQEIASIEPNMNGQMALRLRSRREQLPVTDAFMRRMRQL